MRQRAPKPTNRPDHDHLLHGRPGVDVINTTADIPAFGSLAINAFVLHGSEPVLVDTGTVSGGGEFTSELVSVIDPDAADRFVGPDHAALEAMLAGMLQAAPRAERGAAVRGPRRRRR